VGVFAQITSVFSSADQNRQPDNEDPDKPETLTAVLYPHRRIHIDELVTPSSAPPAPPAATEVKETPEDHPEAEVASFEKDVPSVEETREALHTEGEEGEVAEPSKPTSQIGFLHPLVPEISLTNVSNLDLEPYKKDSQVIRAIMGEILAVFKEIAQLQPIFREQSEYCARQ
jgi:Lon-like ATP-dependent protease